MTDPTWSASGPVRTCIGCRERAPQGALLRVAARDGRPTADPRRRIPGRGGYVHPVSECVGRATRTGSFARALRAPLAQPAVLVSADGLPVQMEMIDRGAAY
jgi:predicted RNA-binding protein YlxR (DUF448 family)